MAPRFRNNPDRNRDQLDDDRDDDQDGLEDDPELEELDREGECPLCDEHGELEYHHWHYSRDEGCWLCRDCHEYIHAPAGARPRETDGDEWVLAALSRLVDRWIGTHDWLTTTLLGREFNVPDEYLLDLQEMVEDRQTELEREAALEHSRGEK